MFIENSTKPGERHGSIEVITGCMFSGKTEELIRRLKRAIIARQKVEIIKSSVDLRYSQEMVVSHDANALTSVPVKDSASILQLVKGADVVGIDEAQFFDDSFVNVCNELADGGIRVIVAGLDLDFEGKPFGPISGLMASAEFVTKVHAICLRCGALAHYSYRTVKSKELVMIGSVETYEPLCRKCYSDAMKCL